MSGLRDRIARASARAEAARPPADPVRDAEARFWGAVALARTGRTEEAVVAYLAASDGWEGAGRLDAALDACMRAVRLVPDDLRIHDRMVRMYRTRHRHDLAEERIAAVARLRDAVGAVEPEAGGFGG